MWKRASCIRKQARLTRSLKSALGSGRRASPHSGCSGTQERLTASPIPGGVGDTGTLAQQPLLEKAQGASSNKGWTLEGAPQRRVDAVLYHCMVPYYTRAAVMPRETGAGRPGHVPQMHKICPPTCTFPPREGIAPAPAGDLSLCATGCGRLLCPFSVVTGLVRGSGEDTESPEHRKGAGISSCILTPGRERARKMRSTAPDGRGVAMPPLARTSNDARLSPSAGSKHRPRPFRDSRMFRGGGRWPGVGYREAASSLERSVTPTESIGPQEVIWGTYPPLGRIPCAPLTNSVSASTSL